jgi:hypothetical protein
MHRESRFASAGSEPSAFAPCGQELVDPLQLISVCQLDQRLNAGPRAIAGQSGKSSERELRVGERQASLDGEPACPLRCGSRVSLGFSFQERQADRERVLEPGRSGEFGNDRADLVRGAALEGVAQTGERMPLGRHARNAGSGTGAEHMFVSRLPGPSTGPAALEAPPAARYCRASLSATR